MTRENEKAPEWPGLFAWGSGINLPFGRFYSLIPYFEVRVLE
jgi:hypothetical protein